MEQQQGWGGAWAKKKTGWRENGGQVPRIMCHLRPKNMWPHVILTCPPPKAKKPPAGCIFPGACPCSLRRAKLSLVAHSKKLQHSLAGRVLRRCKAMIRTAQQLCQSPTPSTRDTHKQKKRQRLGIVIMAESMTKTRPKNSVSVTHVTLVMDGDYCHLVGFSPSRRKIQIGLSLFCVQQKTERNSVAADGKLVARRANSLVNCRHWPGRLAKAGKPPLLGVASL